MVRDSAAFGKFAGRGLKKKRPTP